MRDAASSNPGLMQFPKLIQRTITRDVWLAEALLQQKKGSVDEVKPKEARQVQRQTWLSGRGLQSLGRCESAAL